MPSEPMHHPLLAAHATESNTREALRAYNPFAAARRDYWHRRDGAHQPMKGNR
jgi:hypothetical protein